MKPRLLLPVFAATLFLSAFLIFSVQPMMSKMLLPLLGGSPSVWNTAMVFFQAMLLAGYAYAHAVARFLPLRAQAILHIVLLGLFTMVLPLALPVDAIPPAESGQALWQLGIMLTCIGGPFFILAASAPLFQHWFSASGHEDAENPYFLYAVSNAGSMLALLAYPLLAEPLLTLGQQSYVWYCGYLALIALTTICAFRARGGVKPVAALSDNGLQDTVEWKTRLLWVFLAFIPSSLMLGVTTVITTDLASAPMIWIVPLALYLGTFILAFAWKPPNVDLTRVLTAYALCLAVITLALSAFVVLKAVMIFVHLGTFFLCALLCHSELAKARPRAAHLTEFFLLMSFGGVLGGIFNALIAPVIFLMPLEYSLTLALVPFVIWMGAAQLPAAISLRFNATQDAGRPARVRMTQIFLAVFGIAYTILIYFIKDDFVQVIFIIGLVIYLFMLIPNRAVFAFVCAGALLLFQNSLWDLNQKILKLDRNYFGVIKVTEDNGAHYLFHGTTCHGAQSQKPAYKLQPVTYYSPAGPAADIFNYFKKRGKQNIAGVGLGVGSIACYKAPGRHIDFFEIDQNVVDVALDPKYFSYLADCGTPYDIIMGDGRLKIGQKPDKSYDLIFLDAFSSDNIPIHLMTREALETYLKKLRPGGIVAFNISNRYLDLRPMLSSLASDMGLSIAFKYHDPVIVKGDVSELYTKSLFAIVAQKPETIAPFMEDHDWKPYTGKRKVRAWTDDFANILSSVIGF